MSCLRFGSVIVVCYGFYECQMTPIYFELTKNSSPRDFTVLACWEAFLPELSLLHGVLRSLVKRNLFNENEQSTIDLTVNFGHHHDPEMASSSLVGEKTHNLRQACRRPCHPWSGVTFRRWETCAALLYVPHYSGAARTMSESLIWCEPSHILVMTNLTKCAGYWADISPRTNATWRQQ